jgi:two-component system chemotaxis response regulator CheY
MPELAPQSSVKTVLTVDDSVSARQRIRLALQAAGFPVIEAGDGLVGLAAAESHSAQLVFTDLNMPKTGGLDFLKALRQLPAYRNVPVVFLTTGSDEAVKREARAAGATTWVAKPFTNERIVAVAKRLIG